MLVGALAMPLLMPIADRLQVLPAKASIVLPAHPMTLLEELQARIQAKSGSGTLPKPVAAPIPAANSPQTEKASGPAPDIASAPRAKEPGPSSSQPPGASSQKRAGHRQCPVGRRNAPLPQHRSCGVLAIISGSLDLFRGSRSCFF